jgi:hypothetical protein
MPKQINVGNKGGKSGGHVGSAFQGKGKGK